MLEIQGLEVSYGHFQVLWGVDLEVHEGQRFSGEASQGGPT